jgi:NAD(P)-dependent dehydrogenase (short-subunit alcohol dehydrogenase family)
MSSQTILITGATSGIGKTAALELAQRGHTIFATGRRVEIIEQLREEHPDLAIIPLRLDVTDDASIEQAAKEIYQQTRGHGVDVLINNAGYDVVGAVLDVADRTVRRQFEVNVFGLLTMTRMFAHPMMERNQGRIINISSIGGRLVFPYQGIYHASKFAVEALSDAMRLELAPFNVQVVLIEPGPIQTGFLAAADRTAPAFQTNDSPFKADLEAFYEMVEMVYQRAPGPAVVTRAIRHAVEARRPKTRYVMPLHDRVLVFLYEHVLPTWLLDGVFLWIMKTRKAQQAKSQGAGIMENAECRMQNGK